MVAPFMAEAFDLSSLAASAPQDYVCGIQSEVDAAGKQEHNAIWMIIPRLIHMPRMKRLGRLRQ